MDLSTLTSRKASRMICAGQQGCAQRSQGRQRWTDRPTSAAPMASMAGCIKTFNHAYQAFEAPPTWTPAGSRLVSSANRGVQNVSSRQTKASSKRYGVALYAGSQTEQAASPVCAVRWPVAGQGGGEKLGGTAGTSCGPNGGLERGQSGSLRRRGRRPPDVTVESCSPARHQSTC